MLVKSERKILPFRVYREPRVYKNNGLFTTPERVAGSIPAVHGGIA